MFLICKLKSRRKRKIKLDPDLSSFSIHIKNSTKSYQTNQKIILKTFSSIAQIMKVKNFSLDVEFISKQKIQRLNQKFLAHDYPTDVLSFPTFQFKWQKFFNSKKKIVFPDGLNHIGEIFVSLEMAKRNAKLIGQSVDRETMFLLVHGFLHLLGFDHLQKKDEMGMLFMQRKIFKKLDKNLLWKGCVKKV